MSQFEPPSILVSILRMRRRFWVCSPTNAPTNIDILNYCSLRVSVVGERNRIILQLVVLCCEASSRNFSPAIHF